MGLEEREAPMENFLDRLVFEPLKHLCERLITFLPNLLTALIITGVGLFLGWLLKGIIIRILNIINLDKFCERAGIIQALEKGGIKESPSRLAGKIVYWLVVISFLIMSLDALNIPAVGNLLTKFLLFLPNLFVAFIILIFGYFLSNFLGRAALIASVNAGIKVSGFIAKSVKLIVFLLTLAMALEQLGIGKETVQIAFAIIFGGVILALAIAFGLGGRDIAKDYLERKLKGEGDKEGLTHL